MQLPSLNQVINGFEITDIHELKEYKAYGIFARHQRLGLQVYQVFCDDDENLFSFGFKTLPESANGVAHIVEHTVLCGSKKYPIKDPFMLMVKGSMQTFLNAYTFPDKTLYPAASTVEKDLFNIFKVYADAVWNPLLDERSFRQEGHRLSFDEAGNLIRTGIVYNEMKGNYSSHDSVAQEVCLRSLFKDTAYGHDSGGDPRVIPELSYEEFKDFHAFNYHPSNTLLFLYGNIPIERYFEELEKNYLGDFNLIPPKHEKMALEPQAFENPVDLTCYYPSSDEEKDSSITLNWLLKKGTDPRYVLSWEILIELLIGSPASPLLRALLDSKLGEDLSPSTGLETEIRQLVLSVGLRGIDASKKKKLENLIFDTLRQIAKKGFDPDLVEGTFRRFEFRAKEIKGGPFGLRLMRKAYRGWLHGEAPQNSLEFDRVFAEIRTLIDGDKNYFKTFIDNELLSNSHRTTVTVLPDPKMQEREEAEVRHELDELKKTLSQAQIDELKVKDRDLEAFQSQVPTEADIQKLPSLSHDDLPKKVKEFNFSPISKKSIEGIAMPIFSNGINYVDVYLDLSGLSDLELLFAPLLFGLIGNIGDSEHSFIEFSKEVNLHTGGIHASTEALTCLDQTLRTFGIVRIKFLERETQKAIALLWSQLRAPDFSDLDRISELWLESRNESRSSVIHSGNSYAALKTERYFSLSEQVEDWWRGLSGICLLEEIESKNPKKMPALIAEIASSLHAKLLHKDLISFSVAGDEKELGRVTDLMNTMIDKLPISKSPTEVLAVLQKHLGKEPANRVADLSQAIKTLPEPKPSTEAYLLSTKVAFNAMSLEGAAYDSPDFAAQNLACHILRTDSLWEKIRMKGGAYGASVSLDGFSRIISFSSYRDPRILDTFKDFADSVDELAKAGPTDWSLFLSMIGIVSRELRPYSPGESLYISFRRNLMGISHELRQSIRDKTLALKPQSIKEAAHAIKKSMEKSQRAVIALDKMVDKELERTGEYLFAKTDINPGKGVFGL